MLYFMLNSYMDRLKLFGYRDLPTNAELAQALGITPTSFSRIVGNKQDGPSRKQLSIIIAELRKRGVEATPNDLLQWIADPQ